MTITLVQCDCGAVELQLIGEPMAQYVCHCDDCQTVHGNAFPVAVYLEGAVTVTRGVVGTFTLKTSPRTKCNDCGTYLFAEVPGRQVRGVNGELLPKGRFCPEFHIQRQYAASGIYDDLPHYKDTPIRFGGSGELM